MAKQLLPDFPSGPLDTYRRKASFDWKKLKIFLETEEIIEYQNELIAELQKDPLFYPPTKPLSLDEIRHLSTKRMMALRSLDSVMQFKSASSRITNILDPSASIKLGISYGMVPSAIMSLGTDVHNHYVADILSGKIIGSFCLTEIGHGSNAKFMRTTATFDKDTQEFVLNSPDFEAAKCWAGILGQCATHVLVYAQLVTPDGVQQGLHAFFVNVRDIKTLLPRPGVVVGDMGEKIGLNGIDNGFLMFNNYRVPKTDLLNKTGDVSPDGKYITPFSDPNKRYGASLGALSGGRVTITSLCATYLSAAVTIAIRYAAVRKQFGPDGQDEISILEYQTHQHRLLPYLAVTYVNIIFANYLAQLYREFIIDNRTGQNKDQAADLGIEIHGISSASKPVAGWTAREAIQECREACGGHGYLKAAGLGDLRNDNDANCTYEGENHVLIQQTSNWLLKLWPAVLDGKTLTSPLGSVNFLTDAFKILKSTYTGKDVEDIASPKSIINAYQWLVCYLLKTSYEKMESNQKKGLNSFDAKNENQVFSARNLAIAFTQHIFLQRMLVTIDEAKDVEIKNVLMKLFSLYGIWSLEKHIPTLYQGGFAREPQVVTHIQNGILKLCRELKDDAVALVDVIATHDFILNSVLGKSDGLVYKHLQNSMMTDEGLSKPAWWRDILYPKGNLPSKI